MLKNSPPVSSTERIRQFRLRNPGYDQRFMARQRALVKEATDRFAAEALAAAPVVDAVVSPVVARPTPLMLPAPVVDPMMVHLNALAGLRDSQPAAELVPVADHDRTLKTQR